MTETNSFNIYKDIQSRTGGEIYIGVVGPVRTGKSTFIKRFMDLLVIPNIADSNSKERAIDELPQAAAGKTIMTTEPKFIPKEAAEITLADNTTIRIRLIDCVGYMAEGATGHIENEQERMVRTPWFDYEIPFTMAAEVGTRKVVTDHATIAVVVTTDGTFGELERSGYLQAEERTINELKELGKPFVVILNTNRPHSENTKKLAAELSEKYEITVLPMDCEQMRSEDINRLMESLVSVFPVSEVAFYFPKWLETLPEEHEIKAGIVEGILTLLPNFRQMKDIRKDNFVTESEYIKNLRIDSISMETGEVLVSGSVDEKFYYENLSHIIGVSIENEYQFLDVIRDLADKKAEFAKFRDACAQVAQKGYGIVLPKKEEIILDEPELIHQGNKFGVKIRATAPSIHMIQASIETEIAPIVGSESQAEDLITYMKESTKESSDGIWEVNIFGKTMQQMMEEGIAAKINRMTEDSRTRLQETMKRIINESHGGIVCIII